MHTKKAARELQHEGISFGYCTLLPVPLYKHFITMTAALSAQDQIAAFLADAIPDKIMAFKFSPAIQRRIETLVEKKKNDSISLEEKEELERYLAYDLLIGLAKARAIRHVEK
jgi:hypothetical protein